MGVYKKRKTIIAGALLLVPLILMNISSVKALGKGDVFIPTVQENVYVYDNADMISAADEGTINSILVELEEKTSAEVAVISYEDSDLSLEEYANKLFNTLGIGKASQDNGILLLMQKEGNHVRLEIGSGIDDVFTDDIAGDILDTYYVPYRDDSTSKAALETAKAVASNLYLYYEKDSDFSDDYKPMIYKTVSGAETGAVRSGDSDSDIEIGFPFNVILAIALFCGIPALLGAVLEYFEKKKWAKDHNGDMHIWEARERLSRRRSSYDSFYSYSDCGGGDSGGFGGGSSDGGGASR